MSPVVFALPGNEVAADRLTARLGAEDVPPMSHPMPLTNVFREDVQRPGLTAEEALEGAPEVEQQRFAVPRILGEE